MSSPSLHPRAARRALVIGGGIAGPVTAIALMKAGIDATLVEAHPRPDEGIGGSLALAPNGLAALDVLGIGDTVRDVALPISRTMLTVRARRLTPLPSLPGVEPMRMVGRGRLHDILRAGARSAGVETRYDCRLVDVDEHRDGITARFADGSSLDAEVLVGADGARSTVRRLIDPHAPNAGYTGLLGFEGIARDIPTTVDAAVGNMVFAFGRRAYYLYWPNPDGTIGWGANLPSTQYLTLTQAREQSRASWREQLADAYAGDVPGEALVAGTSPNELDVVGGLHIMPPVPQWWRGRMVLVGDAVHAPSNSTGQGASLAIESSLQLARCLRDADDVGGAFAHYESLRRARVEAITRRGARTNKTKTPGPVGRAAMSLALPVMMRSSKLIRAAESEQLYRIDWDAPAC